MLLFGTGLVVLLTTAAWLRPDPSGQGTHQQLGLTQCTFLLKFGMRCPSCGMTTSWSHLMHGNLVGAARANIGGLVLGLCSLAAAPWLLCSAWLGRPVTRPWSDLNLVLTALGILAITLVDWVIRIQLLN